MISAWWLLLIIPVSFSVGYILAGVVSTGAQADQCNNCSYYKEKSK